MAYPGMSLTMTGFPNATLVSDCWKSHFKSGAWQHQICLAHLLRELNYFDDQYKSPWAKKCKKLLVSAIKIKTQMESGDYLNHHPPRSSVESDMDLLLTEDIDAKHKEVVTFKK
ncbi:transposase, partial [Cryomorpha ignava]|nr:transposase [Cryomorpha ignava]